MNWVLRLTLTAGILVAWATARHMGIRGLLPGLAFGLVVIFLWIDKLTEPQPRRSWRRWGRIEKPTDE